MIANDRLMKLAQRIRPRSTSDPAAAVTPFRKLAQPAKTVCPARLDSGADLRVFDADKINREAVTSHLPQLRSCAACSYVVKIVTLSILR